MIKKILSLIFVYIIIHITTWYAFGNKQLYIAGLNQFTNTYKLIKKLHNDSTIKIAVKERAKNIGKTKAGKLLAREGRVMTGKPQPKAEGQSVQPQQTLAPAAPVVSSGGGGGGSSFVGTLTNSGTRSGIQYNNGFAKITYLGM